MPILPTSRLALPFCLLISAAFLYSSVQAEPPAKPIDASEGSAQHDGRHDFDFELGRWNAHVKKLVHPLSHSTEWDELTGTVVTRTLPMLEGWNESEMRVESPTSHRHLELLAVRLYNPSTRQWAIYGSSITTGVFDPPMIGQFSNGRGELYSRHVSGPCNLRAIHLATRRCKQDAAGTGVFRRWRSDLGG